MLRANNIPSTGKQANNKELRYLYLRSYLALPYLLKNRFRKHI